MTGSIASEASRRRTFAIISHPDAGKTTLTEKLLLYSGAIVEAGAVRARAGAQRDVSSDWMELERQRGISISSTVLRFEHGGVLYNLLDTPGHRDFSEDTYRVLSAVDAAVIVLDAAKGVEAQTLKLFQVAQARGIPLITFINKVDRFGKSPLELVDDIEKQLGMDATPVTWPVGNGPDFEGVVDRRDDTFWRFERTARGASIGAEERTTLDAIAGSAHRQEAEQELAVLAGVGADHNHQRFLDGTSTPVFFGSALWNFGVRLLLDAIAEMAPSPTPQTEREGQARPLDDPLAGFIFKIQANLDPRHRDRIAFMRVCSGIFERGVALTNHRTRRSTSTKYAHQMFGRDRDTVDIAYPGDIVGLVNATDLSIGDSLSVDGKALFRKLPTFAPEHFRIARNLDSSRYKQFRRGIAQLDDEGVIQALHTRDRGEREPILGAVGEMQFEVAAYRLEAEFGAKVKLDPVPYRLARRTNEAGRVAASVQRGIEVAVRRDGTLLALFPSENMLNVTRRDHPDIVLESIVGL